MDTYTKTVTKPENKNQNHYRPISGQGSALPGIFPQVIRIRIDTEYMSQIARAVKFYPTNQLLLDTWAKGVVWQGVYWIQ
jgi:hypothetical protein